MFIGSMSIRSPGAAFGRKRLRPTWLDLSGHSILPRRIETGSEATQRGVLLSALGRLCTKGLSGSFFSGRVDGPFFFVFMGHLRLFYLKTACFDAILYETFYGGCSSAG